MNQCSRLLGKDWLEVGHDGGTEDSAWRGATRWGNVDVAGRTPTLSRRIARTLFRDGLMSMVVLGGLLLSGLIAGLLGPH